MLPSIEASTDIFKRALAKAVAACPRAMSKPAGPGGLHVDSEKHNALHILFKNVIDRFFLESSLLKKCGNYDTNMHFLFSKLLVASFERAFQIGACECQSAYLFFELVKEGVFHAAITHYIETYDEKVYEHWYIIIPDQALFSRIDCLNKVHKQPTTDGKGLDSIMKPLWSLEESYFLDSWSNNFCKMKDIPTEGHDYVTKMATAIEQKTDDPLQSIYLPLCFRFDDEIAIFENILAALEGCIQYVKDQPLIWKLIPAEVWQVLNKEDKDSSLRTEMELLMSLEGVREKFLTALESYKKEFTVVLNNARTKNVCDVKKVNLHAVTSDLLPTKTMRQWVSYPQSKLKDHNHGPLAKGHTVFALNMSASDDKSRVDLLTQKLSQNGFFAKKIGKADKPWVVVDLDASIQTVPGIPRAG